jgi:ribosome-associated protein
LRALIKNALDDLKADDIIELDVRDKTSVADYLFIASGSSNRHVKSIASNVVADAKHAGLQPLGVEGEQEAEWVLVDLGDIIVHVMQQQVREFYDLESLWRVTAEDRQDAI